MNRVTKNGTTYASWGVAVSARVVSLDPSRTRAIRKRTRKKGRVRGPWRARNSTTQDRRTRPKMAPADVTEAVVFYRGKYALRIGRCRAPCQRYPPNGTVVFRVVQQS